MSLKSALLSLCFLLVAAAPARAGTIVLNPNQSITLGNDQVFCSGSGGGINVCDLASDCGDPSRWECDFGRCQLVLHRCADSNAYGHYEAGGGCNPYGCFAAGGGCNPYGCFEPGGGCNPYGCWRSGGNCNPNGCASRSDGKSFLCHD